MPEQYLAERDIPYACFHFRMEDKEYDDDLGKSIAIEDFYQRIRDGAMPTTSQVNPEQYEAMFDPILREGKDILTGGSRLLIHCRHLLAMASSWTLPGKKCRQGPAMRNWSPGSRNIN